MVAATTGAAAQSAVALRPATTVPELRAALSACIGRQTILHPLIAADPAPGMRLAIRFSVTRWGRFSASRVSPSPAPGLPPRAQPIRRRSRRP